MKKTLSYIPAVLSLVAFVVFLAAFIGRFNSFKSAVETWAKRDLKARAELAAVTLAEALATDDFKKIREFGELCEREAVRLRIVTDKGGVVYESSGDVAGEEYIFETGSCGSRRVMTGITQARVMRPFERASAGFALAALAGAAAVMLFFVVTYRQRVRIKELTRLEKFRRDFTADFSHELKTPLAGITGAVELLDDMENLPEENRTEILGMIRKESKRLDALAADVLALSKLDYDASSGRHDFRPADIGETITETVQRFSLEAEAMHIALTCDVEGNLCAECDAQALSRAVSNLVSNALRHSGARQVTVEARRTGSKTVITVSDDGCGVPESERGKIFERFHRVDGSRSSKTGGSGLGLAIVRQIARLHGGEAYCSARKPRGSVFTLRF